MSELSFDARVQPPMANGEVIFDAPWQSRVFAIAVTLAEQGAYQWSDFQSMLIEVVGGWGAEHGQKTTAAEPDYPYFELFQTALLRLLVNTLHLQHNEVEALVQELSALPHGHDH